MEIVKLTEQAVENVFAGMLMPPSFHYKDVSEEGLYRYFIELVERVGDGRLLWRLFNLPRYPFDRCRFDAADNRVRRSDTIYKHSLRA